jgi:hypothetical protein
MEAYELVHRTLELNQDSSLPDNAQVRILTAEGEVYDIVDTSYEADGNTLWLKVEISE